MSQPVISKQDWAGFCEFFITAHYQTYLSLYDDIIQLHPGQELMLSVLLLTLGPKEDKYSNTPGLFSSAGSRKSRGEGLANDGTDWQCPRLDLSEICSTLRVEGTELSPQNSP